MWLQRIENDKNFKGGDRMTENVSYKKCICDICEKTEKWIIKEGF